MPLKNFQFNSSHPENEQASGLSLVKGYTDEDFSKIFESSSYKLLNSLHTVVINQILQIVSLSSFFTGFGRFKEFDTENVVLFAIKVFGRESKETAPVRHFIKVTTRASFA